MSETEDGHATYLRSHFDIEGKNLEVLGIPNDYDTAIPEQREALTRILEEKLSAYLG